MPEEDTWKLISSCVKLGALLLGTEGEEKPSGLESGWVKQGASVARALGMPPVHLSLLYMSRPKQ